MRNLYFKLPTNVNFDDDAYAHILHIFAVEYSDDDCFKFYPLNSEACLIEIYKLIDKYPTSEIVTL